MVGGPTASGKTALAIALARHLDTDIVSADSRQFYREMHIGNARPTDDELASVPHHFIADRSLADPLSAGTFADEALRLLGGLFPQRQTVVVVGGSGLYLRALCTGLDDFPDITPEAFARVEELQRREGLPGLQDLVARLDPEYFARVDRQNGRRLERPLRVSLSAGRPYSSFLGRAAERPFDCVYLQPAMERPVLYDRINRRVDAMLAAGLEAEARGLRGYAHLPVLQTVGYQEWWPYFAGEYDRARAVELIKRNSRRYAKRQATWFRDYAPVGDISAALGRLSAARGEQA